MRMFNEAIDKKANSVIPVQIFRQRRELEIIIITIIIKSWLSFEFAVLQKKHHLYAASRD